MSTKNNKTMLGYFLFSLPDSFYDTINELNKIMKEMLAEQKARIALNNHIAQVRFAKKFKKLPVKPYVDVNIYYPIRATKCNKVGFEQRCRRTTEKKYGKKLG